MSEEEKDEEKGQSSRDFPVRLRPTNIAVNWPTTYHGPTFSILTFPQLLKARFTVCYTQAISSDGAGDQAMFTPPLSWYHGVVNDDKEYRDHLIESSRQSALLFGKTLVTLSGGALAVSMAFIKDIIGPSKPPSCIAWLLLAWLCWLASLAAILVSYYASYKACRRAIDQHEVGNPNGEIVGGKWASAVDLLNIGSAAVFIIGLVFIIIFVAINMG